MTEQTSPRPRPRIRRVILASSLAAVLSVGGATAWALDRFVIEHVQIADVAAYEAASATSTATSGTSTDTSAGTSAGTASVTATATGTTYTSDDASITVSTVVTGSGSAQVTYHVADLVLSDATVLRSAFAQNQFGANITEDTSDIAAGVGAVFAVNGDYYGFRETGIVIRNGVVYRDEGAREGLAFYTDGHVEVYDETATTAEELLAAGVWTTLSFGPALVVGGEVVAGIDEVEVDTNVGNHSIQGQQPRTLIGVVDDNHVVVVVVDGRSDASAGVTMTEAAQLMLDLGCTTAYNLDGGGSSTLYVNGEVVSSPSNGGERGVSDILYVAG